MGQVDVAINGRRYSIACDDGHEDHVSRLAEYLDERVLDLVSSVGQVGDTRLLVMASLLVLDELYDAQASLEGGEIHANGDADDAKGREEMLAIAIEAMAERIENIAASIERA